MKVTKLFFLAIILCISLCLSCNKIKQAVSNGPTTTNFNVTSNSVFFTLKTSTPVGVQNFDSLLTTVNVDSVMKAKGITGYKVDSLTVKSVTLRITNPTGAYFDNFSDAYVSIEPLTGQSMLIASITNIPKSQNSINPALSPNLGNVYKFLSQSSSNYVRFGYTLNSALSRATTVDCSVSYIATASQH